MSDEQPVRLMLVEDQPQILKQLVKALGRFEDLRIVGTASEGEVAVDLVSREKPDVVLMDLELPDIDGIEVTRRLKHGSVECEILVLTSFDDETRVYEAMQAGASGYLVKRIGPEKVRSAIHEVHAGGVVVESMIARRFWNYFQSVETKARSSAPSSALSDTELEILRFLAKGLSNAEVSEVLNLERRSVRSHLSRLYKKLGVRSHVEAVVMALKMGHIEM